MNDVPARDGRHPGAAPAAGPRRWPLPDVRRPAGVPDGSPPTLFSPVPQPAPGPAPPAPRFTLVRRGYDPAQVDGHLAELAPRLAAAATERRRAEIAEDQLREALSELKSSCGGARTADPDPLRVDPTGGADPHGRDPGAATDTPTGFGARAERILREAEREAERGRTEAVDQAGAILAGAREDAASYRREAERVATERAEAAERDLHARVAAVAERERELDRREREIAVRAESVRADSEARACSAERDAAEQARAVVEDAEREARARRARSEREIERLTRARDHVRGELARLHGDLGLRLRDDDGPQPSACPEPAGTAVASVA